MTYTIVWTNTATKEYRTLRSQDPLGATTVADAVRALAEDPSPQPSRSLGTTEFRRLRVGPFRILYRLDDAAHAVLVEHWDGRPANGRSERSIHRDAATRARDAGNVCDTVPRNEVS